jgi:hypothetical protein
MDRPVNSFLLPSDGREFHHGTPSMLQYCKAVSLIDFTDLTDILTDRIRYRSSLQSVSALSPYRCVI